MNPYNPYYFNYPNNYQNYLSPQINRLNQLENQYQNLGINQTMPGAINQSQQQVLQGKAVDSIDVVKAMDVPLDGSITYFPKTDGSAIYTKQLQADGTSRINTYEININSGNMQSITQPNIIDKKDIDKIYYDISDVKKSLENNLETIHNEINNIFNRFDELEIGIKGSTNSIPNKQKGAK